MIFQDTVIDIGRPGRASAKVLDMISHNQWQTYWALIWGSLVASVIIISGYKPVYRVKHLKSEENSINVRELQNTNHVEVSDITPPLCHVCVVHVPGVDKIIFRGITQPIRGRNFENKVIIL